jgi:hypothetical protein
MGIETRHVFLNIEELVYAVDIEGVLKDMRVCEISS